MPTTALSSRALHFRTALLALSSCMLSACIDTRYEGPDETAADGAAGSGGGAGASSGGQTSAPSAGSGGQTSAPSAGSGGQTSAPSAGSGGTAGTATGGEAAVGDSGAPGSGGTAGDVSHVPRLGGALKIMPLGDSITASTCYRARLAELLDVAHGGDYDFVGNETGDKGCGYTYDTAHEGHGGYLVTEHALDIASWAAANPADVVLLHFATNDVWNNVATDAILGAYGKAVDEFRKHNENVTVLVAQIIPLQPSGCGHCDVGPLNGAIPSWAAGKATAQSPIIVVDQFSDFSASADTDDSVHPNESGSSKLANRWAAALDPLF